MSPESHYSLWPSALSRSLEIVIQRIEFRIHALLRYSFRWLPLGLLFHFWSVILECTKTDSSATLLQQRSRWLELILLIWIRPYGWIQEIVARRSCSSWSGVGVTRVRKNRRRKWIEGSKVRGVAIFGSDRVFLEGKIFLGCSRSRGEWKRRKGLLFRTLEDLRCFEWLRSMVLL